MQGFRIIPNLFFPPSDKAIFTATYELPAGTSIERTMEVVETVDRFIGAELRAGAGEAAEGVTNWAAFVGNGGPRFYLAHNPEPPNPQFAFSLLNATSRAVITTELIPRIAAFCQERFPELDVKLNPLQLGPPVTAPVQVRLSGRDPDRLFDLVDAVTAELRSMPGAATVTDDWGMRSKKLVVAVDQPRARRAGVTSQDVAISLQTALSGFETTQYREGETSIPVTLRSTLASRTDVTKLDSLNVYAQATGAAVPLLQVADASVVWEPSTIRRRNRLKTVTVSSELAPGVIASDVVARLRPWLAAEQAGWPPGYRYELGGEEETSVRANQSIAEQLPVAGLIILLLLIGQFNSIRRTAIILLTIPLGLIGRGRRPPPRAVLRRLHDPARHHRAGRNHHQQRHRAHRPHPHRDRRQRPRSAAGRRRGGAGALPADPADDRHHRRRPAAALVRRRPDVGADGHRHHLRPAGRDGADPRRGADSLLVVLPGPLRRVR